MAYIGNKVVERNKTRITSVELESGAGRLRMGDLVRVNGFNFVTSGAADEEFLAREAARLAPPRTGHSHRRARAPRVTAIAARGGG